MFMFLLTSACVTLIFYLWFKAYKYQNKYIHIPGPPSLPILGNALDLTSTTDILKNFSKYLKKFGSLVKVQIGPFQCLVITTDYKLVQHVLSSNKLLTKTKDYKKFEPWLGTGILLGSGSKWKKHRKLLTPAFHLQILENFIETFESCGDILIQKLQSAPNKENVDISSYIALCALDIVCETTMGTRINAQNDMNSDYVHSVHVLCKMFIERVVHPLHSMDWYFKWTQNYRIQEKCIKILHEKTNSVINRRAKELENKTEEDEPNKKKVFLDVLLEGTIDGNPIKKEYIREEVDTVMFAGHDTTSVTVSFVLYCLANHPKEQQKVFEEQKTLFGDNSHPVITHSHLQEMKYLELVIKETLRLYPAVPTIGRQIEEDLKFENYFIPANTVLLFFLYSLHRDPRYFDDPDTFNPERFNKTDQKYPYTYIPFSAGPRNCIGQKYAMLEMKSMISKIIRNFELAPSYPEHRLELATETVMVSKTGVKIGLKRRSYFS